MARIDITLAGNLVAYVEVDGATQWATVYDANDHILGTLSRTRATDRATPYEWRFTDLDGAECSTGMLARITIKRGIKQAVATLERLTIEIAKRDNIEAGEWIAEEGHADRYYAQHGENTSAMGFGHTIIEAIANCRLKMMDPETIRAEGLKQEGKDIAPSTAHKPRNLCKWVADERRWVLIETIHNDHRAAKAYRQAYARAHNLSELDVALFSNDTVASNRITRA